VDVVDHRDRVALVTGGGKGIGEAIARRLAREGLRVVVLGRSAAELERVATEIHGLAVPCDLTDAEAMEASLAVVARAFGPVDVLVNNAGLAESVPFEKTTDALWERTLALNVTAPMRLCRALVPAMAKRGWGRVVNVASNAGLRGYAYTAAYCASKHALVGLTRALAVEYASRGVTINAVCPGFVDTAMAARSVAKIASATQRSVEAARATLEALSPQRRLMTAEEVAHVVWCLVPHEARGVHGQCIALDGGQSA
jgi:NAD(P)-dependent dehydrogenase (short-subunit alcohol dehydrogenase family)